MPVSLRKTFVPVPLQIAPREVAPISIAAIRSLSRLFVSITDVHKNRFNLAALPSGITVLDASHNTATIIYSGQRYHVILTQSNIVAITVMEINHAN